MIAVGPCDISILSHIGRKRSLNHISPRKGGFRVQDLGFGV